MSLTCLGSATTILPQQGKRPLASRYPTERDSGGFACPSRGLLIPKEGDVQKERPTGSHRLIGSFLVKEKGGTWCFAKAHIVRPYLVLRSSLLRTSVKLRAAAIWACAQLPSLKIFSSPSFLRRRPPLVRRPSPRSPPFPSSPPSSAHRRTPPLPRTTSSAPLFDKRGSKVRLQDP